jgi:opacity protein-like surface antigen
MGRAKIFSLAGAAALLSTATLAADLPPLPPPVFQAPVAVATGGWYLRGDVGVGIQHFSDFNHNQLNPQFVWPASWQIVQQKMGDSTFVGFGIGYAWNNWLRFDVTGEYRMKADLKVIGSYSGPFCDGGAPVTCFDVNQAEHSAWVTLANAYLDLGTWWCLTPFIGAGAGAARHQFSGFTDTGFPFVGSALGFASDNSSKWTFAWALHAGVAYNVSNNVKIELAYRYLNFGSVDTPAIGCTAFGCGNINGNPNAFYTLTRFDSQDIKIGVRFMLQPEAPPSPPPLYAPLRKG